MNDTEKTLLVTGAAGFIGANFVRFLRDERPAWELVCLDALTYAGNLANLEGCINEERVTFVRGDICDAELLDELFGQGLDAVVNFAAESHVDRSIQGCGEFIRTNVGGTQILLDAARNHDVPRYLQVSTDEVYGSLGPEGYFTEDSPIAPNSPYSASKVAGDMLVRAYGKTYGLGAIVTRCSNNYGPYQFPEKLIPLFVTNLLQGKKVPVYGDGLQVRDWIHVEDHCAALLRVLERGQDGEVYNIGGNNDRANLEVVRTLLDYLGFGESMIDYVVDRPGHNRRYAVDCSKIASQLRWEPRIDFAEGLAQTVEWYRNHETWWRAIKTGAYLEFYEKQYGAKL